VPSFRLSGVMSKKLIFASFSLWHGALQGIS
jgi:hypothetical protein